MPQEHRSWWVSRPHGCDRPLPTGAANRQTPEQPPQGGLAASSLALPSPGLLLPEHVSRR